jgi:hypothetical protein
MQTEPKVGSLASGCSLDADFFETRFADSASIGTRSTSRDRGADAARQCEHAVDVICWPGT